jgi:Type I phosphodiesterase / nucleotide pyrophosphatase
LHPQQSFERLFVCYMPGMDMRRIEAGDCPYTAGLLSNRPWARIATVPTVDHVPTILTGTLPHEHGLWGPRLRRDFRNRSALQRCIDRLPDLVTTTAQCVAHASGREVGLATVPPRRRRRFDWLRFKTLKQTTPHKVAAGPINGMPTIFTEVGSMSSRFVFHTAIERLDALLATAANGRYALEMVDLHCLDAFQHWNMDDAEGVHRTYHTVDSFLAALHEKCRRNRIGLVLLVDHGMERVTRTVDLLARLRDLDLPPDDIDMFIENTRATFWLHTATARDAVMALLDDCIDGCLLSRLALKRYDLRFDDASYGDAYFYANPGLTFFPNDFYHPIANTLLAFKSSTYRSRLRDPRHRGDHGYLPDSASETAFLLLAEDGYERTAQRVSLVDVAPTILELLGDAAPATMRGRAAFRRTTAGGRTPRSVANVQPA